MHTEQASISFLPGDLFSLLPHIGGEAPAALKAAPAPALIKAALPWSARRGNISWKQQILKRVKGILNKLTLENSDLLEGQLIQSEITTPEILEGVVTMIFYRAVFQPMFCPIYAQLCANLNEKLPSFTLEKAGEKEITFKRILLNRCQETFEGADNIWSEIRKLIGPDQEMERRDKERIVKLCTFGNIQFIGELWKKKLVPDKIVLHIVQKLLGSDMKSCPFEDNVEAICHVYNAIGKQLDENPNSCHFNDAYFNELKDLTRNPQLTPRLKFMVQNVLDLRANNWALQREEVTRASALIKAELPRSARRGNISGKVQVLKKVKRILNKLTVENFDILEGKLIESGITTPEILVGVVRMIFDKAVFQPMLCPLYAQLCADLNEELPRFPPEKGGEKVITFRRLLLNKCQEAFEGVDNLWSEIKELIGQGQEMESRDKERIIKLWTLGNIQFICELWKEKMVPYTIIHSIVQELLGPGMKPCPTEENVEAICLVFNTIGEQLDENHKIRSFNDAYFDVLKDLTINAQLTPRLRLMVQNVIDLRTNNWAPQCEEAQVRFSGETHRTVQNLEKAMAPFEEYERGHRGRHHVPFEPNAFYFAIACTVLLCIVCFILGIFIGKSM